uniref:Uncharacterized protein n=1 Tax=viral metagenome TaxID=1070528 RepID=A0A6C0CLX2_9ZZZZ
METPTLDYLITKAMLDGSRAYLDYESFITFYRRLSDFMHDHEHVELMKQLLSIPEFETHGTIIEDCILEVMEFADVWEYLHIYLKGCTSSSQFKLQPGVQPPEENPINRAIRFAKTDQNKADRLFMWASMCQSHTQHLYLKMLFQSGLVPKNMHNLYNLYRLSFNRHRYEALEVLFENLGHTVKDLPPETYKEFVRDCDRSLDPINHPKCATWELYCKYNE